MKHLIAPSFSGGRKRWLLLLWLHVFSSRESPSVILFDVPSGPGKALFFFRNGSLAYNIIRNTLGHHLIFLQCDHMRKFVLMRRAQVWLVTLSLSLRVLLSLSAVSQSVLSGLSSLHAQRARAVFPRQTRQHSLMGHANTQHTYYICMNEVFLCLWSPLYWIHTEGTTHTRDKVHWPFLFRVFFFPHGAA